jgi:hypothetical protein
MINIKLEVLDKAKKCLEKIDFTKETNYILNASTYKDAGVKIKKILPKIYIMGFNDAIKNKDNGEDNDKVKKSNK